MDEKTSVDEFCSTVKSLFDLYEVLKCCICLEVLKSPIILECKHTFCTDCLSSSHANACPLCRKVCNKRKQTPNEAAVKLSDFMKNITQQILTQTQVDNVKMKELMKEYNGNLIKNAAKPSTSKRRTSSKISIAKNSTDKENKPPQNAFDILLDSSRNKGHVKRPLRTYKNKKKQPLVKTVDDADKILKFQDEQHKESVVKWLMDSQNDFDRITQTQQGPVNQNYVDEKLSSVSQDPITDKMLYYYALNDVKRRRTELRRYGSFTKRCRSLDIQVVKPARCRLKRQSISCDSPDFENTDIEESAEEVEKKVELIQQIEEECLKNLESNNARRSDDNPPEGSAIPASGWDRMRKLDKNIRKSERQPKPLKIIRASSLKKNVNTQDTHIHDTIELNDNPIVNLNEFENFVEKLVYQQTNIHFECNSPEEKRKIEKGDTTLGKQSNKCVVVLENVLVEEKNKEMEVVQRKRKSTRKSTTNVSSNKTKMRKSNIEASFSKEGGNNDENLNSNKKIKVAQNINKSKNIEDDVLKSLQQNELIDKLNSSKKCQEISQKQEHIVRSIQCESEELIEQLSASFDVVLKENPQIFIDLVKKKTFPNKLQKELEKKLPLIDINEKSINTEKRSKQEDTTSELKSVEKDDQLKQLQGDFHDNMDDLLFSMPTQKMRPEQTEEVSAIQRSIEKIQEVLINPSFSSSASNFATVREQINNVQLYLNDLECSINGEENIQITAQKYSTNVKNDNCKDINTEKIVEVPLSDGDILKRAYSLLNNNAKNVELEQEILNITKLIISKQKLQKYVSKNTQTDIKKNPVMKSIGVQYVVKSVNQQVQTLIVQSKEKAIQAINEKIDSSVQVDFEDRGGFHISSTEAFKTLVMMDAFVQTADQNENTSIVLSPSFDNLEFETQDALNDLNKQDEEEAISQILKSCTSKAIQRPNKSSVNLLKSTLLTSKSFNEMNKPGVNKSLNSNIRNINKNKSFNCIGDKFTSDNVAAKKLSNPPPSRKSLHFNNKCNSVKEIKVKSAIPLDIEVTSSNKASSGKSDWVISLDTSPTAPNKEKYKRIRVPSPDSDSDGENSKRFKKEGNPFIRDDISVVFDSETQNKNLEDVSSFGSSGVNMDYIDQIWNKIDNGEFGNPNDNDAEETPSKKFKSESGPSKKISTQEFLEKCDQHIKSSNKKNSQQNHERKLLIKPELNHSKIGLSTDKNKPVKSKQNEINSNPCSLEKLIDDALLDDLNKPFVTTTNKESEDLFVSCLEAENNPSQTESETDKAMADFISSESTKKRHEVTVLQNIVLENPEKESDITFIPDSDDEMFENEPDVIESTPEKPTIKIPHPELKSRVELFPTVIQEEEPVEVAIPPPAEFQDFFQVSEDDELLAQINTDEPVKLDTSAALPITQNFTNSALLSLSPITKEFRNKSLNLNASSAPAKFNQSASTPRSQKQVSIKSFMCKSKNSKQMAEELFGVTNKVKKPCIACSRLNKDQVIAISALTNKKLASYSTVFNSTVTHMIVTANANNCVKDHTMKYVNAVAAGIWVLSFRWIQDSLAKNVLLPEEPYEVLDVSGIPGPKEARLFSKTKKLLKGFKIYAAPPFLSTTQADIENIIIKLGGKIVSKPDDLLDKGGSTCLIITETRSSQEFGQYESWLEALDVVTVDIEWLSHCVGQFKLISFRRFLLCSDDLINNLGYPSELTVQVPYTPSQSTCQ